MIVLDACVLIAHLDRNDAHHDRATRLLEALVGQPKINNVAHPGRILVAPARAGRRLAVEDILDQLHIDTDLLPGEAAGQLAELHAHTGLRMPDCCVLLSAERNAVDLATFDAQLAHEATERGIVVRPGS